MKQITIKLTGAIAEFAIFSAGKDFLEKSSAMLQDLKDYPGSKCINHTPKKNYDSQDLKQLGITNPFKELDTSTNIIGLIYKDQAEIKTQLSQCLIEIDSRLTSLDVEVIKINISEIPTVHDIDDPMVYFDIFPRGEYVFAAEFSGNFDETMLDLYFTNTDYGLILQSIEYDRDGSVEVKGMPAMGLDFDITDLI